MDELQFKLTAIQPGASLKADRLILRALLALRRRLRPRRGNRRARAQALYETNQRVSRRLSAVALTRRLKTCPELAEKQLNGFAQARANLPLVDRHDFNNFCLVFKLIITKLKKTAQDHRHDKCVARHGNVRHQTAKKKQ